MKVLTMHPGWILRLALAGAILLAGLTVATGTAAANGTTTKVILSFLQGFSNFGSNSATGIAEVILKEGEIQITATGMDILENDTYQIWLLNEATGDIFNAGRVSPDASGNIDAKNILPDEIPDLNWSLMFFSVEPPDVVVEKPSSKISIAGRFEVAIPPQGGAAENDNENKDENKEEDEGESPVLLPEELPDTGGARNSNLVPFAIDGSRLNVISQNEVNPFADSRLWVGAGIILAVALGLGFGLGRVNRAKGGRG